MNKKYIRITAYNPDNDVCLIADSNGLYSAVWEFSAFLVSKGFKIIAVGSDEKFLDGNITRINETDDSFAVRACNMGMPVIENGTITVSGKTYTPDRNA